ncbi:MAG: PIN domain-containing protein [Pirellulales bacterium]
MKQVFLDTAGLIAVVNTDDQWHSEAERVWRELLASPVALVTTSLVLIEIGDGLSRVDFRSMALQICLALRTSNRIEIVQSDKHLEDRAWPLFEERPDKNWE